MAYNRGVNRRLIDALAICSASACCLLAGCASDGAGTLSADERTLVMPATAHEIPPGADSSYHARDAAQAAHEGPAEPFLRHLVQLTFADQFMKAGEAYFNPNASWIIFQAVPMPAEGVPLANEPPSPHYSMYVAKLQRGAGGRITGLDTPIQISAEGSANTCGWFHPELPGVVLFGSTIVPPSMEDAPGYSRDRSRYVWQFPREMTIVSRTVREIVDDSSMVASEQMKRQLMLRDDVNEALPIFNRDGYCAEASWSKDGRAILFTQVRSDTGDGDIMVYLTDSGEVRPLVTERGYDGGPFFSPDGKYICYRSDRRGDNLLQLFVSQLEFDADGLPRGVKREIALTNNEHVNWAPFWHPRENYLIYTTSEMGHQNYEVFAIAFDRDAAGRDAAADEVSGSQDAVDGDADDVHDMSDDASGANARDHCRITNANGFDGLPVFSPDGTLMMWTAQRGDDRAADGRPSSQLWIAEVTSAAPACLSGH